MKRTYLLLVVALAVAASATEASADTITNAGLDIHTDGSHTAVGFYGGEPDGQDGNPLDPGYRYWRTSGHYHRYYRNGHFYSWWHDTSRYVTVSGDSLYITFDSAAIFGGLNATGAEIFIDAEALEVPPDVSQVYFNNVYQGALTDSPQPADVPLIAGPLGARGAMAGNTDNSFFTLNAAMIAELQTDTSFTIRIRNAGFTHYGATGFQINGINVQVHSISPVPEPGSMALMGLGIAALAFRRRRVRSA